MRAKKMRTKELNEKIKRLKGMTKVMNLTMMAKKKRSLCYLSQEKEVDLPLAKGLYCSVISNVAAVCRLIEVKLSAIKMSVKCAFSNSRSE